MGITWDPRDELAAAAVARLVADALPDQCETCGGYKADDSTPGWVYKEYDICECPTEVEPC